VCIRVRQADYYQALADADNLADSTPFIEFMLQALHDAMTDVSLKTSRKTSGKMLALIRENSQMTIPELALVIGVTERSIERNLQKLQQENRLRRVGSAKGGY